MKNKKRKLAAGRGDKVSKVHADNQKEFEREMTMVSLELKGKFSNEYVAALWEKPSITSNMMKPNIHADMPEIKVTALPEVPIVKANIKKNLDMRLL